MNRVVLQVLRVLVALTLPGLLLSFIVAQLWVYGRFAPEDPGVLPEIAAGMLFAVAAVVALRIRNPIGAGALAVVWSFVGLLPLRWFMHTDGLHATMTAMDWVVLVSPALIISAALTAGVRTLARR